MIERMAYTEAYFSWIEIRCPSIEYFNFAQRIFCNSFKNRVGKRVKDYKCEFVNFNDIRLEEMLLLLKA